MKRDHLSTEFEPALHSERPHQADPSEQTAAPLGRREEIDAMRDAVANEPFMGAGGNADQFRSWLEEKRAATSFPRIFVGTIAAGLLAGPFAVLGALMTGQPGLTRALYIILFGPVVEELLKQSGMVYLLERRPYLVRGAWQFIIAAAIAALLFASIENVLYVRQYAAAVADDPARLAGFAAFRWTVCTTLHLACSLIASLGLVRVWKHQVRTGQPSDLSLAFPLFVTAMAVHGVYNLLALFLSDLF